MIDKQKVHILAGVLQALSEALRSGKLVANNTTLLHWTNDYLRSAEINQANVEYILNGALSLVQKDSISNLVLSQEPPPEGFAYCDVCDVLRPLADMQEIPAIGYMCLDHHD